MAVTLLHRAVPLEACESVVTTGKRTLWNKEIPWGLGYAICNARYSLERGWERNLHIVTHLYTCPIEEIVVVVTLVTTRNFIKDNSEVHKK